MLSGNLITFPLAARSEQRPAEPMNFEHWQIVGRRWANSDCPLDARFRASAARLRSAAQRNQQAIGSGPRGAISAGRPSAKVKQQVAHARRGRWARARSAGQSIFGRKLLCRFAGGEKTRTRTSRREREREEIQTSLCVFEYLILFVLLVVKQGQLGGNRS